MFPVSPVKFIEVELPEQIVPFVAVATPPTETELMVTVAVVELA